MMAFGSSDKNDEIVNEAMTALESVMCHLDDGMSAERVQYWASRVLGHHFQRLSDIGVTLSPHTYREAQHMAEDGALCPEAFGVLLLETAEACRSFFAMHGQLWDPNHSGTVGFRFINYLCSEGGGFCGVPIADLNIWPCQIDGFGAVLYGSCCQCGTELIAFVDMEAATELLLLGTRELVMPFNDHKWSREEIADASSMTDEEFNAGIQQLIDESNHQ